MPEPHPPVLLERIDLLTLQVADLKQRLSLLEQAPPRTAGEADGPVGQSAFRLAGRLVEGLSAYQFRLLHRLWRAQARGKKWVWTARLAGCVYRDRNVRPSGALAGVKKRLNRLLREQGSPALVLAEGERYCLDLPRGQ